MSGLNSFHGDLGGGLSVNLKKNLNVFVKFEHPQDISCDILVIFEMCQFEMTPGRFEYFSEKKPFLTTAVKLRFSLRWASIKAKFHEMMGFLSFSEPFRRLLNANL